MSAPEKKLLVKLACGHTLGFSRREAPTTGNTLECRKCSFQPRRVVERSWVIATTKDV